MSAKSQCLSIDGIPAMWMRGGTSKGGYFLASDLPESLSDRDALLLELMGSPDPRQIDGMGGANPLTSKIAIVSKSDRNDADVEYLFLQVFTDQAVISDAQNCGNLLAGVGPFAIERGLVVADENKTEVRIFMINTGQVAIAKVSTTEGKVRYAGNARIDGVPGTSNAIPIQFTKTAGSTCGSLLPTGNSTDQIDGYNLTLIDDGMPVVILSAADFGLKGNEKPETLNANENLKARLETIRLQAGILMNLGDVTKKSIPKITLVSPASYGGTISTRTFIPHRCHEAIGVLGAVSVASACLLTSGPAKNNADIKSKNTQTLSIEHPSGEFSVLIQDNYGERKTSVIRTARKLMDGKIFPK